MSSPSVDLPWLFLGARLVFDPAAVAFLVSTSLVWLLAGWHALGALEGSPHRTRFLGFFMLTMVANLLVTVSGDAVTFLLGYSAMGIAAYPLVVHHGNAVAIRVGRSYLLVMIAGEGALLAAILLTGSTPDLNLLPLTFTTWTAAALVVVGFGVKAGIPGLHAWMPATYSVAPTAAASALAGATVGTGVLGLLRFGVFGPDSPIPPVALVLGGAGGAIFGVVRGLSRLEPERILAYSSVSQMGIAIAALGAAASTYSGGALASGTFEPTGSAALALSAFIAHHALAKASLFLGVGVLRSGGASSDTRVRRTRLALLAVPAMALAGLPLTSGALAKGALTYGLPGAGMQTFFLASAAASTALMLHFLAAAAHAHRRVRTTGEATPREGPWLISVAAVVLGVWLWPAFHDYAAHALEPAVLLRGLWPPVLGAGLWGALYVVGWKRGRRPSFTDRLAHRAGARWDRWLSRRQEGRPEFRHLPARARRQVRRAALVFEGSVEKLDQRVGTWTLTGVLFLSLVLTLRALF